MIVYPVFVEKGAHFSTNMVILAKNMVAPIISQKNNGWFTVYACLVHTQPYF